METAGSGRVALGRGRILAAALEIIDRDGLEALTMRTLADALGVAPMATYRHYANKGELLDALLNAVAYGLLVPESHGDWRSTALALARSVRAALEGVQGVTVEPRRSGGATRGDHLVERDGRRPGAVREGGGCHGHGVQDRPQATASRMMAMLRARWVHPRDRAVGPGDPVRPTRSARPERAIAATSVAGHPTPDRAPRGCSRSSGSWPAWA